MKNKKIIFFALFLGLLPFSCGRKVLEHYELQNISVAPYKDKGLSQTAMQADSLTTDSIYFKPYFQGQYIAMNQISLDLSNRLFSFTKRQDGDHGLKDKISSIFTYSNKLYNGQAAGASLNHLFYFKYFYIYSMDDAKNKYNEAHGNSFEENQGVFVLTQRPTDSLKHQFSFVFTFESGKVITAKSTIMTWK